MNKQQITIAFYLEYSGAFADDHYIIAAGFVAFDMEGNKVDQLLVQFKKEYEWQKLDTSFWDHHQELLTKLSTNSLSAHYATEEVRKWILQMNSQYEIKCIVCDCVADVLYIERYFQRYLHCKPFYLFENKYTGWPYITDDFYRGDLKILDAWGLDDKICAKYNITCEYQNTHDPVDDASKIGYIFTKFISNK